MDMRRLSVEGVIFHFVPGGANRFVAGENIVVATRQSALDPKLRAFLRDRLVEVLAAAAQPIEPLDPPTSPVPDLVAVALNKDDPDIVGPFTPLPHLLEDQQADSSPHGLLAIVHARVDANTLIAILKVEQERGISFKTKVDGPDISVEVELEDGLVLTSKTKLFKAGVLFLEDDEVKGYVTDDQTGSMYRGPSSHYWLEGFLGCQYARHVDVLTRGWVRGVEIAARSVKDPAVTDQILQALHTDLVSNKRAIDPETFSTPNDSSHREASLVEVSGWHPGFEEDLCRDPLGYDLDELGPQELAPYIRFDTDSTQRS